MKYVITLLLLLTANCFSDEFKNDGWFVAPSFGFGRFYVNSEDAYNYENGGLSFSYQVAAGYFFSNGLTLEVGFSRTKCIDALDQFWGFDSAIYRLKESFFQVGYRIFIQKYNFIVTPKIGCSDYKFNKIQTSPVGSDDAIISPLTPKIAEKHEEVEDISFYGQIQVEIDKYIHFIFQYSHHEFGSNIQALVGPHFLF